MDSSLIVLVQSVPLQWIEQIYRVWKTLTFYPLHLDDNIVTSRDVHHLFRDIHHTHKEACVSEVL